MKVLKIILCIIAILLVGGIITGVVISLTDTSTPDEPNDTTDCKGDLHFLNKNGVCANCKGQAPTSIRLNSYSVETYFTDGDGYQLSCSFEPENTTLTKIFWKSSDETVATVDDNGYVTYVGTGTARIYATPITGEKLTNICTFNLTRRDPELPLVFERDKYYVDTCYIDSSLLCTDTVRIYENGSANMPEDGIFEWASSNESVVKILLTTKKTCRIQYVGEGSATITATGSNGAVATADVYVGTRLNISIGTTVTPCPVHIGDTISIICNWLPEKLVTDSIKTFRSSNENVLTVDRDGIGTIVGYGEVTITAETGSSSSAVNTSVTYEFVPYEVTSITLIKDGDHYSSGLYFTMAANIPPDNIAGEYPNTVQLSASVSPWNAEDKRIIWTSSNISVVTVDETGNVTAVGGGTATITATAHNGLSVSCEIGVTMFAENVTLTGYEILDDYPNATECKMFVGDSIQLGKQVLPQNHNDSRVNDAVWHSTNTAVATVNDNGLVTAVGIGNVRVKLKPQYALATDNGFAYVDIIVCEPIESVSFNVDSINFDYSQGIQKIDDNHFTLGKDCSLTLPTHTIGGSFDENLNIKDRLHYSSSNKDAVSVSTAGIIRAKGLGDSVITVTTDSGKTASVTVTVTFFAQSIEMQDITIPVGSSVTLPIGVVPEKATPYLGISYDSQYVDIVSDYVFDNGKLYLGQDITITAKQVGSCRVTIDACGPFDVNDSKSSVMFTITIAEVPDTFAECRWLQIAELSANGQAVERFNVGDEKEVTLTDGSTITFAILGFNHDVDVNGNVVGLTLGLKNLYVSKSAMNDTNLNTASSVMSAELASIYELLPEDLRAVIKTVQKQTSAGGKSRTIKTTEEKLFLFSEKEVFGTYAGSFDGEGTQYAYFVQNTNRVLTINGTASNWLLRSPTKDSYTTFRGVYQSGVVGNINANTEAGVCFGFCV